MNKKEQVFCRLQSQNQCNGSELVHISKHYKDYIAQFRKQGIDIRTHKIKHNNYAYELVREQEPESFVQKQLVLF